VIVLGNVVLDKLPLLKCLVYCLVDNTFKNYITLVIIKVLSVLQWIGQCITVWQNTVFIQHKTTYSMLKESILWKHYKRPSGLTSDDLTALCFDNLFMFGRILPSLT
jgi:hypothetical protein